MSDRVKGFTVVLEENVGEDYADMIVDALKMVKGVIAVEPLTTDPGDCVTRMQLRHEIRKRVLEALDER